MSHRCACECFSSVLGKIVRFTFLAISLYLVLGALVAAIAPAFNAGLLAGAALSCFALAIWVAYRRRARERGVHVPH